MYKTLEISNERYCEERPILKYSIKYPEFHWNLYRRFNYYYKDKALKLADYCDRVLYKEALDYCHEMKQGGFPIREYELVADFTITEDKSPVLSLYYSIGKYTGGANGTEERKSDNWYVKEARQIKLKNFFPCDPNYISIVESEVIRQIGEEMKNPKANYFAEYESLVKANFKPDNYNISKGCLTVYFDEITIAPHSSGICSFKIPFVNGPVNIFSC